MRSQRALSLVLAVVAFVAAWFLTQQMMSEPSLSPSGLEGTWGTVELAGRRWEAPGAQTKQDLSGQLEAEVADSIEDLESVAVRAPGVASQFTYIEYGPQVDVQIEGAMHGALKQMEARYGVSEVQSQVSAEDEGEVQRRFVDGTVIRRADEPLPFRMLLELKGQELFQVVTSCEGNLKDCTPVFQRILGR